MTRYSIERIDTSKDASEPMAVQLHAPNSMEPSKCMNVDGIGKAVDHAERQLQDWTRTGERCEALLFHGPVQDDEYPDACEASFRILTEDGRVTIEPLDPQAGYWLADRHEPLWIATDIGCHADGSLGHEHVREILAGLVRSATIGGVADELAESLEGDGPDDLSDESEAIELLQAHTADGLVWGMVDGDLLLQKEGEQE